MAQKSNKLRTPTLQRNSPGQPLLQKEAAMANVSFWFFIVLALVLVSVLRLYMISDQILLNDEWHGMNYVIGNSFSYLFTHFGYAATCIPLNLYRKFLLETFGWSEILLRLPSLAAGILSLVVFLILVKKIISRRATIIFAFLLAISPFLVFYSRVCRPYSMFVLFGFASILSLYFWATSGERKYAVLYVVTAVLAVYFHLFAAIAVLTPLVYLFVIKLLQRSTGFLGQRTQIVPSLASLTFAGISMALLLSIFLLPAFLRQSPVQLMLTGVSATLSSLVGASCVLSGTANKFMVVLFWVLFGVGQVALLRKKPLFGGILLSIIILYVGVLLAIHHDKMDIPIVVARYAISVLPLCLVSVALALDSVLGHLPLANLIAVVFPAMLFFAGPLAGIYDWPNNFPNHSAFQEGYEPLRWDRSYTSDIDSRLFIAGYEYMPPFYQRFLNKPDTNTIIEYPMMLGDNRNLYYYYQHFHKKTVIVGYFTELDIQETESEGVIYNNMKVDEVLSRVTDTSKLKFRNMVDMLNIEDLRRSRAQYIILHKNLMAEMFAHLIRDLDQVRAQVYTPVIHLDSTYRQFFGPPALEDYNLIVFKIAHNKSGKMPGGNAI